MTDKTALLLLFALQALLFFIVQPFGEFPVNDDWAYAHSAIWLVEEGRIRLSEWIAPNIAVQTLLGGTLSWIFGFSFELLRHLTQVVSLLASLLVYCFFRAGRLTAREALLACLVVIAMPSWLVLANSYMTDMYGLLLGLAAATLLLRAFATNSVTWVVLATAVMCLGMLQRQVLLVIPFAFALGWLWHERNLKLRTLLIAALPLLATVATEMAFYHYLVTGPGVPHAQEYGNERFIPLLMQALRGENGMRPYVWNNFLTMAGYLGLFAAAWFAWWGSRRPAGPARVVFALLFIGLAIAMQWSGWLPPYLENNTIDRAGIGPFTLYDGLPRELAAQSREPGVTWRLAGIAAAFGVASLIWLGASLLAGLVKTRRLPDGEMVFLLGCVLAYVLPFLITGYFDRYLLFILPFIFLIWSRTETQPLPGAGFKSRQWLATGWVAWVLLASALATHDYFEWNRARWSAIELAEQMGATPDTLDGGFEYNGFYRFEAEQGKRYAGKSFWWVKDDEYIITFSEVSGYEQLQVFPVNRYNSRSQAQVRLMRRETSKAADN